MKERILITGGAGYIGSILTPYLLEKGFHVTVLDNLQYRQNSLIPCFSSPRFQFIQGDVCHESLLREQIQKADILIPLAALVGAKACEQSPLAARHINYENLLFLLRESHPQQIILYPNTNSGYGVGASGEFCTEKSPLNPISLYGRLKVEAEKPLLDSGRAISFRLATVFGLSPRMRLDLLVNDFTFRACQDRFIVLFEQHFKRNYIHIRDIAYTFLFGIEHFHEMRGEAFNVGLSQANLSKKELCETIQQFIPSLYIHSADIGKDPDQRNYIVSNEKLESLGWKPQVSLVEGIQEMIAAYPFLKGNQLKNA